MLVYNEFIQNIIDTRGQGNIPVGEYYESHHIIPICMAGKPEYRNKKLKHENLIGLYPEEHFIAHELLALENPNNSDLFGAWHRMAFPNKECLEPIFPEEYKLLRILTSENNSNRFKSMSDDEKERFSNKISIGLKSYFENEPIEHYNARIAKWHMSWSNKSELEKLDISRKHSKSLKAYWSNMFPEEYEHQCEIRKKYGTDERKEELRIKMSGDNNVSKKQDVKDKISISLSDREYYNNGVINKRIKVGDEVPEGFVIGKLPTNISNNKCKVWVNDGLISKMVDKNNIPEGFVRGRL